GSAPPDGPFSAGERVQLRARSPKVRADAVLGLQRYPPSPALFDVVSAAIRDPDAEVRRAGALVACLLEPDEAMRATSQARALSDAMSGLLDTLAETVMDDESGRTHATATDLAEAIATFDQDPAAIVARGIAWLQSTATDLRTIGAHLLVRRSEQAADALARGLRDKHPDVRDACARALSRAATLPPTVGRVIAGVIASARGGRGKGGRSARASFDVGDLVCALGRVRGAPDLVERTLRPLLDDEDVRGSVIEAFGAWDAPAATRRECVWPWLADHRVKTEAAEALHEIGVEIEEILAGIEALGRRDEKSRLARGGAYLAVARRDARAIAPIERMLDDHSEAVVSHALDLLAWAMELQPAARPALERAAKHRSKEIQVAARKRLRT
ncbi:MAG TPA: hypothetical protein VK427_10955, partial [Kofleriaceae bacterium]|nr:hypothetical protein [Kofleriaceae bacterium]